MEVHLVLVGGRVVVVDGRPPLPVKLGAVVSAATGARGRMTGRRGGGGGGGLQVSLLKRLLQVNLELEGWLGHWVGQVVRHIDLGTHREQREVIFLFAIRTLLSHERIWPIQYLIRSADGSLTSKKFHADQIFNMASGLEKGIT